MPSPRLAALLGVVLAVSLGRAEGTATHLRGRSHTNPIQKVVDLLWMMKKKIEQEGGKEEALFKRYTCFCETGRANLEKSISADGTKAPQLKGNLDAAESSLKNLKEEMSATKTELASVQSRMSEAKSLREKEEKAFERSSNDFRANIEALGKAIAALQGGTGTVEGMALLQSDNATVAQLRSLLDAQPWSPRSAGAASTDRRPDQDGDSAATPDILPEGSSIAAASLTPERREALAQLLSTSGASASSEDSDAAEEDAEASEEGRSSGEVLGICQQLKSSMEGSLARAIAEEEDARSNFRTMEASSKKEAQALTTAFENKQVRYGTMQVEIVNMREDLESTAKSLDKNQQFISDMKVTCDTITATYGNHKVVRAEELITITETIRILGSDESRALFRHAKDKVKNAAAASFLQLSSSSSEASASAASSQADRRKEAAHMVKMAIASAKRGGRSAKLDLLLLALRGRKVGFDKVIQMSQDMIVNLRKEQKEDDTKKAYCIKEATDSKRTLRDTRTTISDLEKAMNEEADTYKSYEEEIATISKMIQAQDAATEESRAGRKANHEDYVELMAANKAAIDIIEMARNRLTKFYNPSLAKYEPPSDKDIREEMDDRGSLNPNQFGPGAMAMMRGMTGFAQQGSTNTDADADEDADADADSSAKAVVAQPGAPAMPKQQYEKEQEGSASVLEMLAKLENEIRRDTTEAEVEEKNHQASYVLMVKDSKEKRGILVDTLMQKESVKAATGQEMHKLKHRTSSQTKQKEELENYISSLDQDCSFLLANYEPRKQARASEEDSLRSAEDVLSGAS